MGEILEICALIYYATWFLWPFVLVFGLGALITGWIKVGKPSVFWVFMTGLSLLLILAGITAPLMLL
ncbi:MAG: hypothetical protein IKY34_03295 [Ruminiclostridium sp.]|nr:hypothetical protein [Ruminiclostridium sp.]